MMTRILVALSVLSMALTSQAETGHRAAAAHAEGIPTSIWFFVFNFVLYVALLIFLLRKPVRNFFPSRESAFKQALVKAEHAKREAELNRQQIADRLARLEETADSDLAQAKSEAQALRATILQDAQQISENLKAEAQRTGQIEIERAKKELREELLAQAIEMSRQVLTEKMADTDQKRLQTEFVQKIQVVR